jgi:hypothetical protein
MQRLLIAGIAVILGIAGAQAAGDAQAGKAKAAACASCHGANGQGVAPNPALAGKTEDQLAQAMQDYKSGKRPNAVMKERPGYRQSGCLLCFAEVTERSIESTPPTERSSRARDRARNGHD